LFAAAAGTATVPDEAAAGSITYEAVATTTQGGTFSFNGFGPPTINNDGDVAFNGSRAVGSASALYRRADGNLKELSAMADFGPGNPSIAPDGSVAFLGTGGQADSAIYSWLNKSVQTVLQAGDSAPDHNTGFETFLNVATASTSTVAFSAELESGKPGIFLDDFAGGNTKAVNRPGGLWATPARIRAGA